MIIDFDLSIIDTNYQSYNDNYNYLIVDELTNNIIHKNTGRVIVQPSTLVLANSFVNTWGRNQIFNYGFVDCYYDNQIRLADTDRQLLITNLLTAYFNKEYHPMDWLLWL